jgi:hypothetical protein
VFDDGSVAEILHLRRREVLALVVGICVDTRTHGGEFD